MHSQTLLLIASSYFRASAVSYIIAASIAAIFLAFLIYTLFYPERF